MKIEISNEQIYEHFETHQSKKYKVPIEGAEPNLINNLSSLSICPKCLEPQGNMTLPYGQKVKQCCYCNLDEFRGFGRNYNYSTNYTTCYCCGLEVVTSGFRWSSFFCRDCNEAIINFNNAAGRCVIPFDSFSEMNGIWFHKTAPFKDVVNDFNSQTDSESNLIERLDKHRAIILRRQLKLLKLPENASLLELSKAVIGKDWKQVKEEAQLDTYKYMLAMPFEKYVETPMPPPKIESEFTSEPEISCVFYTLVIRNEAINQKYEGGLKAFVAEHRAQYNNDITVTCFMSSDNLYEASEMLQNKGLKWEEDFTYFDATAMSRKKPKVETIPFKVKWLKGYCSKDHSHVSLIRQ